VTGRQRPAAASEIWEPRGGPDQSARGKAPENRRSGGKVYAVSLDQDIRRRFIDRLLKEGPGASPIGNEQHRPAIRHPGVAMFPFASNVRRRGVFHFRVLASNSVMKAWSWMFFLHRSSRFPSEVMVIPPMVPTPPLVKSWGCPLLSRSSIHANGMYFLIVAFTRGICTRGIENAPVWRPGEG
jgi:hypothetical protein